MGKKGFMEFVNEMKAAVKLKTDKEVDIVKSGKTNGCILTGLSITTDNDIISTVIYLDNMYEEYLNGMDREQIVTDIIRMYEENRDVHEWDVSYLSDYGRVAPLIRASLVNYGENVEMLKGMPHRKFLDLAVVYHIEVEIPGKERGTGGINVQNVCLELWGVSEADLYGQAMRNMEHEALVMDLCETLEGCLPNGELKIHEPNVKMLVLTNKKMWHGAAMVLQTETLDNACMQMQTERLVIIPSSIHETILIPYGEDDMYGIDEMINEVNREYLDITEVLSGHPYIYDKGTKTVSMADGT